ncbi:hypothetical protein Poly30_32950 [Planctomycetes bacterium Poly30]|uniref:Methylamine utilisation protein MauE domain-containing protein n=1 Tax=Saltatorellus ferox TaxID=2528018 RepID=A0A518EUJ3_9BACT|nr:hypothetical protein Poly30_32950 [Planctomycetes bacterium Poly30]
MTDSKNTPALPGFALSAGMLWLLVGALYKLFDGSPNDLPKIVTEYSPFASNWETMRAAIIIELAVVGLVIAKPRLGWLFLVGAYGTFLAILYPLVQEGAASCGCFGSSVTMKPETMMAIDGGLLALIVISRPWRIAKESGLGWAGYLPLLAVAIAGPWMKLTAPVLPPAKNPALVSTEPTGKAETPAAATEGMGVLTPIKPESTAQAASEMATDPMPGTPVVELPQETPAEEPVAPQIQDVVVEADPAMPEFFELRPDTWEGKDFYETDISRFIDQSEGAVLPNSHVVVYRQTCEVCQEHLEELWQEAQNDPTKWSGERQLVLIRVIENKDTPENNRIELMPEPHQRVSLPALKRGYGITTPMAFDVNEMNVVENIQDLSKH